MPSGRGRRPHARDAEGALAELRIGRPDALNIDIGPVITAQAQAGIAAHIEAMKALGRKVEQSPLPPETAHGTFAPPTIIEIESIADLSREVFGPVLHILRFRRDGLDRLIDQINAAGYGLTFGLHTRLDEMIARVAESIKAGNIYVNRNIIGAVVGVQPFGGRGLSGTGPKVGGPLYLSRLVAQPAALGGKPCPSPSLLQAFADWLDDQGEAEAAAQARRAGDASPLGVALELSGPVGERNLYRLRLRGLILLRPATRHGLFRQMAAVLATGNHGLISGMALPAGLPAEVAARFTADPDAPFAAALVEGDAVRVSALVRQVADMPGPVVPIDADDDGYRLEWLMEEMSTSINTVAAGGNASLMTLT